MVIGLHNTEIIAMVVDFDTPVMATTLLWIKFEICLEDRAKIVIFSPAFSLVLKHSLLQA